MSPFRHPSGTGRAVQDIAGGILLIIIAVLALYLVNHLPAAGRVGFASGTAPRLFAYALAGLGAFIAITGWLNEGPEIDKTLWGTCLGFLILVAIYVVLNRAYTLLPLARMPAWFQQIDDILIMAVALGIVFRFNGAPGQDKFGMRKPLTILGAVLLFAIMIRVMGLMLTGIPMMIMASYAAEDYRWKEAIVFAIGITIFCAFLFPYALGQPIPLWPTL